MIFYLLAQLLGLLLFDKIVIKVGGFIIFLGYYEEY